MSHAAVLLAGGKSSRMGCDKAALLVNGEPLWQRQLATLRATEPAELFISGKSNGPYANAGVEVLADEFPDCGPLGGIATALRRCKSERVLVLAVDMPAMSAAFLGTLLKESHRFARGIVPSVAALVRARALMRKPVDEDDRETIEPLAAVYPRAAFSFAAACLHAGEHRMEIFVRNAEASGLLQLRKVAAEELVFFENWNQPEDMP